MSSSAGELPFDSGKNLGIESWEPPRLEYDGERVVTEVVWPLADEFSRRDWRQEAVLGEDVRFPERGVYNGNVADVLLRLGKELRVIHGYEPEENDDEATVCTVSLSIAVKLEKDHRYRQRVLDAAKFQVRQAFEQDPHEYNEAYTALQVTHDLTVSQINTFMFDSEGNRAVEEGFIIGDSMGGIIWDGVCIEDVEPEVEGVDPEEVPGEIEFDFNSKDMELLSAIVDILKASQAVRQAIEDILLDPTIHSADEEK